MMNVNYSIKQQRLLERMNKQNVVVCCLWKICYLKTQGMWKGTNQKKDNKTVLISDKVDLKQNVLLEINRTTHLHQEGIIILNFHLIIIVKCKSKGVHKSAFRVEPFQWSI